VFEEIANGFFDSIWLLLNMCMAKGFYRLGDVSWSVTSAASLGCSVNPEGLAKLARSLDEIDHVDLLLEEDSEEVSIILAA